MTPPQLVTPVAKANPPAPPEESSEIKAARNAAQQAGYARNRAELAYQQAVKEQGEDSEAAKAAKGVLEKAQAEVESSQGALRKLLKPASGSPSAKSKQATPPQKVATQAPKADEAPKKVDMLRYIRGEMIFLYQYRGGEEIRRLDFDSEQLRKLVDEIESTPQSSVFERIQRNFSESADSLLRVLRKDSEDN